MKKQLKSLVFKTIGLNNYLKLLHVGFNFTFRNGLLKSNYIYKYHYFVHNLIKEGDTVLDIGANLGYYTRLFSNLVGDKGHVYAVEPVKPFYKIIQWALGNKQNCTLYNVALGTTEEKIQLSIPKEYGYLRTGLPQVDKNPSPENSYIFDADMVMGSKLFAPIPKIDYIKCDIEGYEEYVLPEIKSIIDQHKPTIQIESWGDHLTVVMNLMNELGYDRYVLHNGKLYNNPPKDASHGDYIFIHSSKKEKHAAYLA